MSAARLQRDPAPSDRDRLLRRLNRALAHAGRTHELGDVVRLVMDGRAQWWGDDRACIVTELIRYPQRSVVRYWLCAGEMEGVLALQGEVDGWARARGATLATLYGRDGWGRLAAAQGWRRGGVILHKELGA